MVKPKDAEHVDDDEALEDLKAMLDRLNLITSAISKQIETLECNRAKHAADAIMKGARVRITRRDKYYKRQGVIVGSHGKQYWDIQLTDPVEIIFKKSNGFEVVG